MLTSTDLVQHLRRTVDPARVTVTVDTVQNVIPIAVNIAVPLTSADRLRGVTKTATTTVDDPVITAQHGTGRPVTISLDRLDPASPRWVATLPDASQMVLKAVGDIDRLVADAELPTRTGGHAA